MIQVCHVKQELVVHFTQVEILSQFMFAEWQYSLPNPILKHFECEQNGQTVCPTLFCQDTLNVSRMDKQFAQPDIVKTL